MAPLWAQGLALGLIQGVTEFLPISSSAHLILLPLLTGWPHLGRHFDIALHLGTLLAIAAYFEDDLRHLRLLRQVTLAAIPPAIIGLLCGDWFEKHLHNPFHIGLFLALFGMLMGLADAFGRKHREAREMTDLEALALGLAQAVALIPGVSRCGATLTVALALGLTRREAARISFLSALPVTAGACLLKALKLGRPLPPDLVGASLLGIGVAALSGWLCIDLLLRFLRNHGLRGFVVYRLLLGLALVFYSL
ncbi:undecaprenyl-diphosphate phosphatase [bacterium]|nr:undecaprenyl-diphosphate phosphatase [bacterium]